ncbi:hypothetical protein ACFL6N_04410 [Thermodesulfobacteriota bacterium]
MRYSRFILISILWLIITACANDKEFTVGGQVNGLNGIVVLQNNGGDDLVISTNGPFTFATKMKSSSTYSVSVLSKPDGQVCTVANGNGIIHLANVTDVSVNCTRQGFVVHDNAAGGTNDDFGNSLAIDNDGKVLVTGYSVNSAGNRDMAIWRYNANETLDTTFGGDFNPADSIPDGFVVHDNAAAGDGYGNDVGLAIVIDNNGKIVVTGYSERSYTLPDMVIWRYNANGTLDSTFGGDINPQDGIPDGFIVFDHEWSWIENGGYGIVIDNNGNILVTGFFDSGNPIIDMVIWRYTADGVLDRTFGADVYPADGTPDGFVTHHNAAGGLSVDNGFAIALDLNGKIVVTGSSFNKSGDRDMVVWRYNSNGTLDTTFGGDVRPVDGVPDGFVVHDNAAGGWVMQLNDVGRSLVVDKNNRILVAGASNPYPILSTFYDMVIWRYTEDGTLDTTFGGDVNPADGIPDGFVVQGHETGVVWFHNFGNSIKLDSNDKILVSGDLPNSSFNNDMAIWRFNENGSLDTTFGEDLNPVDGTPDGFIMHHDAAGGGGDDSGKSLTLDSDGNILVTGGSMNSSGNEDMVIWRYIP